MIQSAGRHASEPSIFIFLIIGVGGSTASLVGSGSVLKHTQGDVLFAQNKSSAGPRRTGYNRPVPTRLRMGLVMRRDMAFGELGDVEGALRAEGVGLAPISTGDASLDHRRRDRAGHRHGQGHCRRSV
jgi:hypothetical protein